MGKTTNRLKNAVAKSEMALYFRPAGYELGLEFNN